MNEPTCLQRDAASVIFNLPDYRVIDAIDLPLGGRRVIVQADAADRLQPEDIGHIHAHGLGTRKSDLAEAQAISQVFGDAARRIPVVAAKSQLANAGAGAGALEVIASLLALNHGHLFPIRNFNELDPECPVRPVTRGDDAAGSSFLNLNMFGRGLASCVAVGAFRE